MNERALEAHDNLRTAAAGDDTRWLVHLQLWRPDEVDEWITPGAETAAILLGGTFDLVGGTSSWPARGARTTPFEGRAMVVFLPPDTPLKVRRDAVQPHDEILFVSARQPVVEHTPEQREALSRKPLLPMAGSNKSFDPATGEWKPAETFASAAESLPPRRFQRLQAGAATIERLLGPDYKASTLCVDEIVVPAGATLSCADVPERPRCDEALLFTRAEGGADRVVVLREHELDAASIGGPERTYAVLAYAGKSAR